MSQSKDRAFKVVPTNSHGEIIALANKFLVGRAAYETGGCIRGIGSIIGMVQG
jgi:hypothetical protein